MKDSLNALGIEQKVPSGEAQKDEVKSTQKKEKVVKLSEDARMRLMLNNKMKEMETEFDVSEHLVIDLGNCITKVGWSGEDLPTLWVPSMYGKNKSYDSDKKADIDSYEKKYIYGYDAWNEEYKDTYNINFLSPGDHKLDTSPELLDYLREVIENKMGINSTSDYDVIINVSPIKNEKNIKTFLNFFLTELGFKAIALVNSASLSWYSTGRTSGLVVECGETRTYTVPIFEGFPWYHALSKNKLGGRDLTQIFSEGVIENNLSIRPEDIEILRSIKEKTLSVPYLHPYDYYWDENNEDIISAEKVLYKLPDNTIISFPRKHRILAGELLFNPSIVEKTETGLNMLLINSIKKSSIDNEYYKQTLLNNIVLSGGTTMMPGFSERISRDLKAYQDNEWTSKDCFPKVISENNRYISKWIGMSMIASMSAFEKLFIKKFDYSENGDDLSSVLAKIF